MPGERVGGVELLPGPFAGSQAVNRLDWTADPLLEDTALLAEALRLVAASGLEHRAPDRVIALLPVDATDDDRGSAPDWRRDERLLAAAGLQADGPSAPWEVGRRRYRFHPP